MFPGLSVYSFFSPESGHIRRILPLENFWQAWRTLFRSCIYTAKKNCLNASLTAWWRCIHIYLFYLSDLKVVQGSFYLRIRRKSFSRIINYHTEPYRHFRSCICRQRRVYFFSERICDSQMSVLFSIYLICVQRSISALIRTIPRAVTFTLKFFSADNALLYDIITSVLKKKRLSPCLSLVPQCRMATGNSVIYSISKKTVITIGYRRALSIIW